MAEPVLSVAGLSKAFGALRATDAVDLDLRPGEIHALIGPNGAGKSTLIKLITGELTPDAGQIVFDGRNIDALDAEARAQAGLARSFQVSSLMPEMSALQNVMLAETAKTKTVFRFVRPVLAIRTMREAGMAALARVGMAHRAATKVSELSHGERRQLEIAIAL